MDVIPDHWEVPAHLPRHAFSVRDAPRAGDVWRCFQEVAVEASTRAGWPPTRYREEGSAFVMRSMTTRHGLEPRYGETLSAKTWVRRFRREMFSTREVRMSSPRGEVAAATQEWVHVSVALAPTRAPASLTRAFPLRAEGEAVELPAREEAAGEVWSFELEAWHGWMDPLHHVNHPAYLDWCDEATMRAMATAGLDPVTLRPIAERLTFLRGVGAGEQVRVVSRRLGAVGDAVAIEHRIVRGDEVCVKAVTVRALTGDGSLFDALG